MQKINSTVKSLTPLLFHFIGEGLLAQTYSLQQNFTLVNTLGVFFLFVFFLYSLTSWGKFFNLLLFKEDLLFFNALLGSIFLALLIFILGIMGFIGQKLYSLHLMILYLGLVFPYATTRTTTRPNTKTENPSLFPAIPTKGWENQVTLSLIFLLFALLFFKASIPQKNGDPLFYHLLGPKVWYDLSQIRYVPHFASNIFMSGLFENLYLWGVALMAPPPEQGLVAIQIFCQWLHLTLGFWGTLYFLYQGVSRLISSLFFSSNFHNTNTHYHWALIISLLTLIYSPQYWTIILAKPDMGCIFWFLGGWSLLLRQQMTTKSLWVSGIILGIATSSKLTTAGQVLFFCSSLLYLSEFELGVEFKFKKVKWWPLAGGFLLGMSPILLRNYYFMENPFFPMFSTLFPQSKLSHPLAELFLRYSQNLKHFEMGFHLQRLHQDVFQGHWLLWSVMLSPLLLFKQANVKNGRPLFFKIYLPSIFLLIFYSFFISDLLSMRLAGIVTFLPAALGLMLIAYFLHERIRLPPISISSFFLCLVLYQTIICPWPLITSAEIQQISSPLLAVKNFISGDAYFWIEDKVPRDKRIAICGNSQLYYLRPLSSFTISDSFELSPVIHQTTSPREIILTLRQNGVEFLLETRTQGVLWGKTCFTLFPLVEKYRHEVVLFQGRDSRMIDLVSLEKKVRDSQYQDFLYQDPVEVKKIYVP